MLLPSRFRTAYIGLGANLPGPAGPPAAALRAAALALAEFGTITGASSLWSSAPVGPVWDQPPFINAALRLETPLSPDALLQALFTVERRFGRTRGPVAKGPRTLDLDLLLMEESGPVVLCTPDLVLPHPELHRRRFVLAPLCEFAADLRHPTANRTLRELLNELPHPEAAEPLNPRVSVYPILKTGGI